MSRGGIETMLMNYYRHIDRTKVQFDFLCNSYLPGSYDDEILSMGGRIFRTPGFNPLKRGAYKKYMKQLFKEHPEYRIVEAHNGPLGRFVMKDAKENNIPLRIYHAHGAGLPFNKKWPVKYYCLKTLKYSMNRHFICSKKAGLFYLGKDIMDRGDYQFIPNAINVADFVYDRATRDELRAKNGLNDKMVVGHVGRLSFQKNHTFLLKVFAYLHSLNPKTHLVLVGDGELRDDVLKEISDLGIKDAVTLTGVIPDPQKWYQAFDIFVMPSRWEGLPVTGIEAQAADLPCLFSSEVTDEVALSNRAQFLDLSAPIEKWADKINEMLNNATPREDATKLITDKHYNIEVEAKRLQDLYIQMMESDAGSCQ